ncbi:type VI secretion system membrane subunit TssM [Escherichia coli]|uniref:type VI secretion system membrane subunit TssM n=1 Tax=Escherichia coli TaxID=562 RepID=UPI001F3F3BDB|nr:type VI secretion system membrane subunit TssM [Escherichia coli]MCF1530806.1 type VI secretion system membrane subunit TssM [Escherichia coli]
MIQIDLPTLVKRLNLFSRQALEMAASECMSQQAAEITVSHVLIQMLAMPRSDLRVITRQGDIGMEELRQALTVENYTTARSADSYPAFSPMLVEWLKEGWLLASAEMQHSELRGGVLLLALLHSPLRYIPPAAARLLTGINRDRLQQDFVQWTQESAESVVPDADGKGAGTMTDASDTLLARYAKNMTADARNGRLDPVLCRDHEIDLMIDILCRRRKNNPVVVGEAGVGKSALIEGLALRIVAGQVPDKLKNTDIMTLDLGALQAGASVKGEFEKRFKGLMAEVISSPVPVILFIDEAHTLIGAGNQQGGLDISNLLKPALARGELKTIAATTWSEYKKYFEKDAALSRRFQLVKVSEPNAAEATIILRGLSAVYEQSHGVLIDDDALQAAATLSERYLSGRQLPDKAIDVLDTACARVAINLSSPPKQISALTTLSHQQEAEIRQLERELRIGLRTDTSRMPSLFNGLVKAMNAAPPESEEKLAVLRVMRMLEDKSGRNNQVVKQYMAKRWSEKFHGQRDIQAQLMSHLDYALAHTDWHAERQAGDGDAISRWTPYDKPVVSAQKELSKLPVYQRVYQSLKTRALGVLPADLNLRDQVGPTFDQVFTSADDNKLVVPQFLTRYGLQSYFVKQRDELVELTAMDSWVLNLTRSVKYSDADRAEIQRQLTEQYISDYTATWRAGMDNLNIRNFESIGQLTGALEQVISGDQPLQRALTVLRDNTQPGVFSEKLSAKEREEALAEPDYQLLTRLGHEFAPENSTLAVQKDKESTMQAVYQQLTELHRYLLAIQNAPVPGKSALKAVQLRLDQNSSDPIFATRQMAKTLPAPLNRWVGRLTDQAWHVVMVEAVHYMEVDWRDSVVKPFNEQLANNYPFNPRSAQDASLDAFERFFKPDGILDTFYQQNLKLFIDNDLSLEDGDNNVIIREDIIAQLETAQKIRDIFFSKQNGLGTSFAVETVSLSGNKRRSVLNLDGQLVDYSQGRNYTAHLVWPNNMREGNESKLTLIGISGNAPRSISFSGPWAQFRLFGAGQLTGVQDGNFTVRFSVDGGAMTYRVHTDTEDNPFNGGLFSQFGLSDTLY